MIFILFVITVIIALYAYQNAVLKVLSPTFWASGMFAIFSGIYVLTYNLMLGDIHFKTIVIIIGAILAIACGEYLGTKTQIKWKEHIFSKPIRINHFIYESAEIYISVWKVTVFTIVYLVVSLIRLREFISKAGGISQGITAMLWNARTIDTETVSGFVVGNMYINQIVYFGELATFILLYVFIYNFVRAKKVRLYLLIILIPDIISKFLTTNRVVFIQLLFGGIIFYFFIRLREGKVKNLLFSRKLIVIISIFLVVFFWYGRMRNGSTSLHIVNTIQAYSSSAIYIFDKFVIGERENIPYFGYFTLQNLYSFLGIEHSVQPAQFYEMVIFNINNRRSNIYTSLYETIQDYGIIGMLFLKMIESFITTKILKFITEKKEDSLSLLVGIYFSVMILYAFLFLPIGNSFSSIFMNPGFVIRRILYIWILVRLFFKPKIRIYNPKL